MPVSARHPGHDGYDVGTTHEILRLVESVAGEVELEVRYKPAFDFARSPAELELIEGGALARAATGSGLQNLILKGEGLALGGDGEGTLRGVLRLRAGERRWLVLKCLPRGKGDTVNFEPGDPDEQLRRTLEYWEKWAADCTYHGPYRREVMRSALALKLLTYEPSGAVVAAPTTSLPEDFGGVRNWDYRYTWLRDSSLIHYALMTIGYEEEATDFFEWLCRTESNDPQPDRQIMYTIDGGRDLAETELANLSGYCSSLPVRAGNGAARQNQLDIYGDVLSAAYLHYCGWPPDGSWNATAGAPDSAGLTASASELRARRMDRDTWSVLRALVDQAAKRWQEPDNSIWEVRGGPQRFLYSRLMCWAALDRGVRLAEHFKMAAPFDEWRATREDIRRAILTQGYNQEVGAFTQAFGSSALDASALYIPLTGFLPPTDPRVQSTMERIRQDLTRDGLVFRYRADDGLPGSESTFTLCSLWLVDNLALSGRLDEAQALFEKIAAYANDVGLLSEGIDAAAGQLTGNFPQGFTHMALIGAAVNLAKAARHGAEAKAENEAQRADRARRSAADGHSTHSHEKR
jgi:GH15 family glucan-1,4-alpha-glucosidase